MEQFKYYIISKLHKHASAVIDETENTLTIQKLKVVDIFDEFTNDNKKQLVSDTDYPPSTESKNDLSKVFDSVELTKDYWKVYEALTGIKRIAVNANDSTAG